MYCVQISVPRYRGAGDLTRVNKLLAQGYRLVTVFPVLRPCSLQRGATDTVATDYVLVWEKEGTPPGEETS